MRVSFKCVFFYKAFVAHFSRSPELTVLFVLRVFVKFCKVKIHVIEPAFCVNLAAALADQSRRYEAHQLCFRIIGHRVSAHGEFRIGYHHISFQEHLFLFHEILPASAGDLAVTVGHGGAVSVGGYFIAEVVSQPFGKKLLFAIDQYYLAEQIADFGRCVVVGRIGECFYRIALCNYHVATKHCVVLIKCSRVAINKGFFLPKPDCAAEFLDFASIS